jgi:acetyl esterase/lipase
MKKFLAHTFFVSLLAGTILTSCSKKVDDQTAAESNMKNVQYGSNASQNMDAYLPAGRTSTDTKVIIFIHGGSWSSGDKIDFDVDIAAIRPQVSEYAIFNINYRLANSGANVFPAQIDDVQAAIDFITNKASEYKINPSYIGLVGASAGAHLALLQAYKFNTNGKIKAVVDLFGPTNLTSLYNDHPIPAASQPVLLNFLGATPVTNPVIYQQSSPINYVTAQSPPTLILHGDADYIVPIVQSTTLKTKLQSFNVKVDMKTYAGEGHGWYNANLLDTYSRAIAFIKENVR